MVRLSFIPMLLVLAGTSCALFADPTGSPGGDASVTRDGGHLDAGADESRVDAGVDGGGVDAGQACTEPPGCCCDGDVVFEVVCVAGAWQCEGGEGFAEYFSPDECADPCVCNNPGGTPCCDDAGSVVGYELCETGFVCEQGSSELCTAP